jgi:hypothetical protein
MVTMLQESSTKAYGRGANLCTHLNRLTRCGHTHTHSGASRWQLLPVPIYAGLSSDEQMRVRSAR